MIEKEVIIIKEYLLSINKFQEPKQVEDKETIYILLQRLLLLTPGSIQSHPEMGVGLITKWRYSFLEDIDKLKSEIENQIEKYLPTFQGVDVQLTPGENKNIIIEIVINKTLYRFKSDGVVLRLSDL